jgi:hypothetical protein
MAAAPSVANDTQFCKLIPNFENSSKTQLIIVIAHPSANGRLHINVVNIAPFLTYLIHIESLFLTDMSVLSSNIIAYTSDDLISLTILFDSVLAMHA